MYNANMSYMCITLVYGLYIIACKAVSNNFLVQWLKSERINSSNINAEKSPSPISGIVTDWLKWDCDIGLL